MAEEEKPTLKSLQSALNAAEPSPGFFDTVIALHSAMLTATNRLLQREVERLYPDRRAGELPMRMSGQSFPRSANQEEESVIEQWWIVPFDDPNPERPRLPVVQMVVKGLTFTVRVLEENPNEEG